MNIWNGNPKAKRNEEGVKKIVEKSQRGFESLVCTYLSAM